MLAVEFWDLKSILLLRLRNTALNNINGELLLFFIKVSSVENFPHFQPIEFILLIFMCFFPLSSFFNKQILVFKTMNAICHKIFQCHIPVQGTMPCLLFLLQPLSPCTVQCSFPISLSGNSLNFLFAHVQIVKFTKISLFIYLIDLSGYLSCKCNFGWLTAY